MIVSCYVREQQRYSKNQLRSKFAFDEHGIEQFIKNLKSYGIVKTVANNAEQREMTDLVEEDIELVDENVGNDDCLYVFCYVGIVTVGNRVIKVYPKYLPAESVPQAHMKLILKVLERYSHSDEQIIRLYNGNGDNRSFNLLAVILFLLKDYYEYGIYSNSEDVLEVNGEGEIVWSRTIDDGFAIIEANRPFYPELITRRTIEDDQDYFKRLHECILTVCSQQLHDTGLAELFDLETISLSEESLEDFGDREFVLEQLFRELSMQFNTRRQMLLKTMIAFISQDKKMLIEDAGISMYGTTAFHEVWETACAEVYGNKLDSRIGQLGMLSPLAQGYDPKAKLIELIEHPEWCGQDVVIKAKDTLIPDLITLRQYAGQDWFIIFDAKYYLLQLEKGKKLHGNPGVGDVTKQYMYQLAYRKFIADHHISVVKNCFLMPTDGKEILNVGEVRMGILSGLGLANIQIRKIPAAILFQHYVSRKRMDITILNL